LRRSDAGESFGRPTLIFNGGSISMLLGSTNATQLQVDFNGRHRWIRFQPKSGWDIRTLETDRRWAT